MQAAMPAMTNTSIVAKVYGGDYKYAAMLTVVSTLLAVITTPFYMWVLRGQICSPDYRNVRLKTLKYEQIFRKTLDKQNSSVYYMFNEQMF